MDRAILQLCEGEKIVLGASAMFGLSGIVLFGNKRDLFSLRKKIKPRLVLGQSEAKVGPPFWSD